MLFRLELSATHRAATVLNTLDYLKNRTLGHVCQRIRDITAVSGAKHIDSKLYT